MQTVLKFALGLILGLAVGLLPSLARADCSEGRWVGKTCVPAANVDVDTLSKDLEQAVQDGDLSGGGTPAGTVNQLQTNAGSGAFGAVPEGTAGQLLQSQGAGAAPIFTDAPVTSAPAANWVDVNWDTSATPCADIQNALQTLLEDNTPVRIRVSGTANVTPSNFRPVKLLASPGGTVADGDADACFAVIPTRTNGYDGGMPVADGSDLNGTSSTIQFENAYLNWDCTGQARDNVFAYIGGGYLNGVTGSDYAAGKVSRIPTMDGSGLKVQMAGDCDGGRAASNAPSFVESSTHMLTGTSRIMWFINGAQRWDRTNLTESVTWVQSDHDDVQMVNIHGWGNNVDGMRSFDHAVGLWIMGSNTSTFSRLYLTSASGGAPGIGVLFGDPVEGGILPVHPNCVNGTCTPPERHIEGFTLADSEVESHEFGEFVAYTGGQRITFDHVAFERSANPRSHTMIVGAHRCVGGSRPGAPVGYAATDCSGGTVTAPTYSRYDELRFIGRATAGDKGHDIWDGLVFGPGYNTPDEYVTFLDNLCTRSDLANTGGDGVFGNEVCAGRDPAATGSVVFTNTKLQKNTVIGEVGKPIHAGTKALDFFMDGGTVTLGGCMRPYADYMACAAIGTPGAGGPCTANPAQSNLACTAASAKIPLDFIGEGPNRYVLQDLTGVAGGNAAADECSFELRTVTKYSDDAATGTLLATVSNPAYVNRTAFQKYIGARFSPTGNDQWVGLVVRDGPGAGTCAIRGKHTFTLIPTNP